MNTFLRLKMDQFANLVKKGQVLAYFGDNLRDINGSQVDNGFYAVNTCSIRRSYNKADAQSPHIYGLELSQVAWHDSGWKATPITHTVELRREGLNDHFCIQYPGAAIAAETFIKELIKDVFKKAGRIEDFDESIDYDRIFGGMAFKLIRKNPFDINEDDRVDMIHDALLQVINKKTVKKYDAKKDIVKFFGGMFQKRMIDQLRAYTTRRVREKELQQKEDFTQEETQEYLRNKVDAPKQESPQDEIEFRELQDGLLKFLMKQRDGDWQRKLWVGLMKGMSNKEIAEQLDVSPAFITKKLKNLQGYVLEFADSTDNDLLADLMKQMGGRRRSQDLFEAKDDEATLLFKIFKKYKKVVGHTHKPAGSISKVLKKNYADHESYDYIVGRILDSNVTTSQFQSELDTFFDELEAMDDLIEEGDRLIGLKVITNLDDQGQPKREGAVEVRTINPGGRDLTDDAFYKDILKKDTNDNTNE